MHTLSMPGSRLGIPLESHHPIGRLETALKTPFRKPKTENWKLKTGNRQQETGIGNWETGNVNRAWNILSLAEQSSFGSHNYCEGSAQVSSDLLYHLNQFGTLRDA